MVLIASVKKQNHQSIFPSDVSNTRRLCTRCPLLGECLSVFPAKPHEAQSTAEPGQHTADASHAASAPTAVLLARNGPMLVPVTEVCVLRWAASCTSLTLQLQQITLYRGNNTFKGSDVLHFSEVVKYHFSAEKSVGVQQENWFFYVVLNSFCWRFSTGIMLAQPAVMSQIFRHIGAFTES